MYTYETVPETSDAETLGNPFWDTETDDLYFVDFFGKLLFRYSWAKNTTQTLTVDNLEGPTSFIPIKDSSNEYLVSVDGTAYVVNWDGQSDRAYVDRTLFTFPPNTLINSIFTSDAGELFAGSIASVHCEGGNIQSLYRYTPANGLELIFNNVSSTVGSVMYGNTLFHMDGCDKILYATDVHPKSRSLSE